MLTYSQLLTADLYNLFCNHSFVGCIDQTRVLLQHEVSLDIFSIIIIIIVIGRQGYFLWIYRKQG